MKWSLASLGLRLQSCKIRPTPAQNDDHVQTYNAWQIVKLHR